MAEGFTYSAAGAILRDRITSDVYICLSTTTPDKNGANFNEPPISAGYCRAKFGTVDASKSAQVANKNIIFIFEATADCGSVTHVGLANTEAVGTTPFLIGKLVNPITIGKDYVPLIRAHKFVVGLDKEALEPYD